MLGKHFKDKNQKIYRIMLYVVVFLGTILVCTLSLAGKYEMRASKDDIGMLAVPAKLAGLDWSNVVSTTRYYGFVWYVIFTPLLKYCDSPVAIWNTIVYCNIGIIAITACLAFYISVKYLEFKENFVTVIWCIFCITVTWYGSVTLSNESPLVFGIWLVIWAFCKFESSQTPLKKGLWLIICELFCTYAFLIHTRAEILYVALAMVLVLHGIRNKDKKYIGFIICYIISTLLVFVLTKYIRNIIIVDVWKTASSGDLQNVEVKFNVSRLKSIFTREGIHVCIDTLLCNMYTAMVRTNGVFCIAFIGTIVVIVNSFHIGKMGYSEIEADVMVFSMASTCAVLLGVVLTWGVGIIGTYSNPEEVNEYYKGMTYFRYYGTFLSPSLIICLKYFGSRSQKGKAVFVAAILLTAFLYFYEYFEIAPLRQYCDWSNSALKIVLGDGAKIDYAGRRLAFVLSIFLITSLRVYTAKYADKVMILIMIIQIYFLGNFNEVFYPYAKSPSWVDASYKIIDALDDDINIYVPYNLMAYRLQFLAKNKSLIVDYPEEGDTKSVIISIASRNENIPQNYKKINIKGKEYLWYNIEIENLVLDKIN